MSERAEVRQRRAGPLWATAEIRCVEDLRDAVHGAGLDAIQYSSGPVTGSLSVAQHLEVTFTVAELGSRIGIRGPLSPDRITLGLGLRQPEGSKQWMRDVRTGAVGIFLPDEEHDGLHAAGASYVTMALSRERLEELAEDLDLVVDSASIRSSGLHPRRLSEPEVAGLVQVLGVGSAEGPSHTHPGSTRACRLALQVAVAHIARPPRGDLLRGPTTGHGRIVARARNHVMNHLHRPISIEEMAKASFTSVRSLHRAFRSELGESPASYVRRIRLHRVRRGLATEGEMTCTVTQVAYRNGITQLGRMARCYRELFGELPSETLASGGRAVRAEGRHRVSEHLARFG